MPFVKKLSGNKVPIGNYTFKYYVNDKNNAFVVNSAESRGMEAVDMGEYVEVTGNAAGHESMIRSFQGLNINGMVTESTKENRMREIEIKEDVRIPGTNVILEKGDRIRVNEDRYMDNELSALKGTIRVKFRDDTGQETNWINLSNDRMKSIDNWWWSGK